MAASMMPPALGAFSLRVQLFAPTANALGDKPVRSFRVVISPEATVREFCEEASRIHQMNYGQPVAIKKCQDDQEFDVTQEDIVGHLFANLSIIRITHSIPGMRDSMPVDSALRYDPGLNVSRKRTRETIARPNGPASPTSWIANKRQRVSDIDPDEPIPSRETGLEINGPMQVENGEVLISNSRGSNTPSRANKNPRDVRNNVPMIPETPPPESTIHRKQAHTDRKSLKPKVHGHSPTLSQTANASPFREEPTRNQDSGVRAKSASYHIQRATERGRSVSTAATSPEELDAQLNQGLIGSTKRIGSEPVYVLNSRVNGKPASKSPNERSIYENIESDSEGAASVLSKTKASLKLKKSSPYGSPGQEQSGQFKTTPASTRWNFIPRELHTPSELPLTPSSREMENERFNQQASVARKSPMASEAIKQRKREPAEEARMRQETKDGEVEARQNAMVATAARLEIERVEKVQEAKRLDDERLERVKAAKRSEDIRVAEEKCLKELKLQEGREQANVAQRHERERNAKLRQEREVAELGEKEEGLAEETKRSRQEMERKNDMVAKDLGKTQERAKAGSIKMFLPPANPNASNPSTTGSSQLTPTQFHQTPIRPPHRPQTSQSSTPFIPSGRKSSLKPSISSPLGSSPLLTRNSRSGSYGSDISANHLDRVHPKDRRVSFAVDEPVVIADVKAKPVSKKTPILPPASKLTPKPSSQAAPILPSQKPSLTAISTPKSTPMPRTATPPILAKALPTEKRINTPILPPSKKTPDRNIPTRNTALLVIKPNTSAAKTPASVSKPTTSTKKVPTSTTKLMPPVTKIVSPPVTRVISPVTKVIPPVTANGIKLVGTPFTSGGDEKQPGRRLKKVPIEEAQAQWEALQPIIRTSNGQMSTQRVLAANGDSRSHSRGSKEKSKSVEPERLVKPASDKVPIAEKRFHIDNLQHLMSPSEDSDAQDDRDIEMASTHSSSHDSRSPVIFSQHMDTDASTLPSLAQPVIVIDDDETQSGNEYLAGVPEEKEESSSYSNNDSSSDDSDAESKMEDTNENTVAQVPQSSPDLPGKTASKSSFKPEPMAGQIKLPSSASSAKSKLIVRSSITTPKPNIKGGASLSAMNAKKPSLGSSASKKQVKSVQTQIQEASGSESDSDSSTDSSDDDDEDLPTPQPTSQHSQVRNTGSDSTSTSGSDSDEDEGAQIRNELAAEIARMASEDSHFGSTKTETAPRVMKQAGKILKKKKPDKYVQGYRFSQVL